MFDSWHMHAGSNFVIVLNIVKIIICIFSLNTQK